ncbi:hypothetical protein DH2020_038533 [Rehmannia glutinosa]|uniref:TF-B3 domain-containing protein n=1 Tax=Rehmannia glutinosa TaxID=99300 RepID=A0ABR0UYI9_REHGL
MRKKVDWEELEMQHRKPFVNNTFQHISPLTCPHQIGGGLEEKNHWWGSLLPTQTPQSPRTPQHEPEYIHKTEKGDKYNQGGNKMVRRGIACDECTKKCETLHQKPKDLSPTDTRFFKVMFGKDYWKVMYLPPEFARTVKHLAGQETQIEDSSGLRWSVTLSYVDGSLAIKKGWNKFFLDHGLKEGHFLVFNYINASHFVVQIYGETACERTNFNNVNPRQNKRPRRNPEPVSPDEPFQTIDLNSREKHSSADSVASGSEFQNREMHLTDANAMNIDDPACLIIRDDGYYHREDRNFLYDLSCFEVAKKLPAVKKFEITEHNITGDDTLMAVIHTNEINGRSNDTDKFEEALGTKIDSSHIDNTKQSKITGDDSKMAVMRTNQINGNSGEILVDKFEKYSGTKIAPSQAKDREQTKMKGVDTQMDAIRSEQISGHSGDIVRVKPSDKSNLSKNLQNDVSNFKNGDNNAVASDSEKTPSVGCSKIAEREYSVKLRCSESSVFSSVLKNPFDAGKEPTIIPKHDQILSPVVKVEPDLHYDTVSSVALNPFSAEVKSQSYLELPIHIPSVPRKKERGRGKVVYLRDSTGRLFPVLYPDLFSVKALTGNWTRFCEQNNIKPGDECRFQVENDELYFYKVDVTHRDGEFPK